MHDFSERAERRDALIEWGSQELAPPEGAYSFYQAGLAAQIER
jgi:hypothetical protein